MSNIFETDLPQPGQRMTESAHRKIELQSPADLTFLIANVTRAAREKLDRHLPPDATSEEVGEDAMRIRVEQILDEVSQFLGTYKRAREVREDEELVMADGRIHADLVMGDCSSFGIPSRWPRIAFRSTGWGRGRWSSSWPRRRRVKVSVKCASGYLVSPFPPLPSSSVPVQLRVSHY